MAPISIDTSRSNTKTDAPKLWILLVAVKEYASEYLPSLGYSAFDCQGLAQALAGATTHFTTREVYIHHDFALQQPTKDNVLASINKITQTAKSQDTILFYFSGHGILEPLSHQAILCLRDTQKSNLLNTGLVLQELLQLLSNSGAENKLVWLDACHSGGITLVNTTKAPTEALLNPASQMVEIVQQRAAKSKGFYALLSCDANQLSWEFPELSHGIFTYYLIRGLEGEAADSHGMISIDGLYRYIYHQTLQYIDKTNQQLRLINQQKRSKGEQELFNEYPLQTPKRIVEGVGEMIIGRIEKADVALHSRLGLVIEGLTGCATLEISKLLSSTGAFELEYLQATKVSTEDIKSTLVRYLQAEAETVLLYLRGYIEETEASECLVLGHARIKRSWLKQQLRHCAAKQIIILDCPAQKQYPASLQEWIEDLQIELHTGQCLIGCISTVSEPERFIQTLLSILKASSFPDGLSAAGAISKLQVYNADANIPLSIWLSATKGIIEIIPANNDNSRQKLNQGVDIGVCPYMGLSAFCVDDYQYFYGRETLTQQLVCSLVNSSFLAVVGASGSGKSSLVQAGLIPQLRSGKQIPSSQQWLIISMRPGASPIQTLAHSLGDNNHLVLEGLLHQGVEAFVYWLRSQAVPMTMLVIDQFEELFTLAPATDREKFLELLQATEYALDRFKLVITLRADFIATCLEVPILAKVLQQSSILVPPKLTLDDYRRVITNPAQQVGLKLETELVEVLLRELDNSVGELPILSFVLEQLWQHRSDGQLTLRAYQQKLGGIQGALERSCQAVYESLDDEASECAKWIFLSLTQLGEGTEDTRRRVFKSDLLVKKYSASLIDRTLSVLTSAKLIVVNLEETENGNSKGVATDGTDVTDVMGMAPVTVEVAHEILIRHWSTLRWWLEENRERLRKQRQIEHAAQLWLQGKQNDFLLHGVRLAEAEDIYIKYTDELSSEVQDYIEACLVERKRQQLQEKKRLKQAQRAVVALSVLGIAACSFGGLAYWQGREAQLREINALNESSRSNLLSHSSLEAVIASVKAGKQLKNIFNAPADIKFKTINTLGQALKNVQELNRLEGHNDEVRSVDFSPDGQTLVTASNDNTVRVWSIDGREMQRLSGKNQAFRSVKFSPGGKQIAAISADNTVKLWTFEGKKLITFPGQDNEEKNMAGLCFSPNGQIIAASGANHTIKLWHINGQVSKTLTGHTDDIWSLSCSPDGQTIVAADRSGVVKLWRMDGQELKSFRASQQSIFGVSFSPDGKLIATAGGDTQVKLWNLEGEMIKNIGSHNNYVIDVRFSPDGRTLASVSMDKTAKLWSLEEKLLKTFSGHNNFVSSLSFRPNGQMIATSSGDGTVRLWKLSNDPKTLIGHTNSLWGVSTSPNGKIIATAGDDQTIRLWYREGQLLATINAKSGGWNRVRSLSFSPDGKTIAAASYDKSLKLWSVEGKLLKTFSGHNNEVMEVSFSPDGQTLATASYDGTIKLWQVNSQELRTLKANAGKVRSVSFSPDGRLVASGHDDGTIKLWNQQGQLVKTIHGHNSYISRVRFSPDGKTLASASRDRTIKLWTLDGHQLKTFAGHSAGVTGLSFSPNGKTLVSSSEDGTIKQWSIETGQEIVTITGQGYAFWNVSFNPDGKTFVSVSDDAKVEIWTASAPETEQQLIVRGCNWLRDYLKNNVRVNKASRHICDRND